MTVRAKPVTVRRSRLGVKWLLPDGRPPVGGGTYAKSLPKDGRPGRWRDLSADEPIQLCVRGYHVAIGKTGTAEWGNDDRIPYLAETRGVMTSAMHHTYHADGKVTPAKRSWGNPRRDRTKYAAFGIRLLMQLTDDDIQEMFTPSGKQISAAWLRKKGFTVLP